MNMAPEMQVKQYVGEVTNLRGITFRVLLTGSARHYLFCLLGPDGCDTTVHVPVLKSELATPVKRALANGMSYDARAHRRLLELQDA